MGGCFVAGVVVCGSDENTKYNGLYMIYGVV